MTAVASMVEAAAPGAAGGMASGFGLLFPALKELLPGCIVPLFEAAAGLKSDAGWEKASGKDGEEAGEERGGDQMMMKSGVHNGKKAKGRLRERKRGSLACLEAVLEACDPGSVSSATVAAAAVANAAGALQRYTVDAAPLCCCFFNYY